MLNETPLAQIKIQKVEKISNPNGSGNICSYCREPMNWYQTTCGQCGKVLGQKYVCCPDCGEQASVREKCPECHVKIQADWQYFPSCRTDLKQVNQT